MKKLFINIKYYWFNIYDQYKQYKKDKKAKKNFPKIIKEAAEDRESIFNQYGLQFYNNYKDVAYVIDIPEEYQLKGQQWQIMDKLNESSYFMSKYLREDLGIGENLSQPEYFHIEDPSSNTPLSCRYLAIWHYADVLENKKIPYIINSIIAIIGISIISIISYCIYNYLLINI